MRPGHSTSCARRKARRWPCLSLLLPALASGQTALPGFNLERLELNPSAVGSLAVDTPLLLPLLPPGALASPNGLQPRDGVTPYGLCSCTDPDLPPCRDCPDGGEDAGGDAGVDASVDAGHDAGSDHPEETAPSPLPAPKLTGCRYSA